MVVWWMFKFQSLFTELLSISRIYKDRSCSFRIDPLLGLPPWSKDNKRNTCNLVRRTYWQADAPFDAILQSSLPAQHPHTPAGYLECYGNIKWLTCILFKIKFMFTKALENRPKLCMYCFLFLLIRLLCWLDFFDRGILGVCKFISLVLLISF